MDNNAEKKFLEIKGLFTRMSHQIICPTIESYYIWRTLTFARSIPEVGKEKAEEVAKQMGLYQDFFMPTENSHLNMFVVGLVKFFDKDPRSLSFANLIELIKENKELFTPGVIKRVNPHAEENEAYLPITDKEVLYFEEFINRNKDLVSNLEVIRNKQLAHTDMEAIQMNFIPIEIEKLIADIQDMFNTLSTVFDRSSTTWDHLKEASIQNTKFLLENLERGEKVRLEEFRKQWEK